jgi:malic enzyme
MQWSVRKDKDTGKEFIAVDKKGRPVLLNPFTNKGTAFTHEEREAFKLHGLIPPAASTIDQQLERTYQAFRAKATDLEKYIYLSALQDRNETLFYRLVHEHIDEMMPIVYTPVVGQACQEFSHIYRRARGLYISYDQRDNIENILSNSPYPPAVIVATDGERILGLGDQGSGGMGIPIGKLSLYTLCAGVPPYRTLPIMLDVGTDNRDRLADPLYLGLRQPRIRGEAYQDFIDRFVAAVQRVFPQTLLQWEDLLKENAIRQLARFRHQVCSFNDDIQGTAAVVLAGVVGALRITGQALVEQRILFAGAGASATGISHLLVEAMHQEGLPTSEGRKRIWLVDSRGLVTTAREGLEEYKAPFARDRNEAGGYACRDHSRITLEEAVRNAEPTILIGTSGTPNMFSEAIVRLMAKTNRRPVIFPLSNPTSKSECTPEDAIRWSDGRAIVATGSPFPPVTYNGNRFRIGQGNNAFVFPGIGLGVWLAGATQVTDGMFLEAARALSTQLTESDLEESSVYPQLTRIRDCSLSVACAVIRRAVSEGHASAEIPASLEERVGKAMWFPEYRPLRYVQDAGWGWEWEGVGASED